MRLSELIDHLQRIERCGDDLSCKVAVLLSDDGETRSMRTMTLRSVELSEASRSQPTQVLLVSEVLQVPMRPGSKR